MDALASGNTQTEAVVVSQQDLSGGGVSRASGAIVVACSGGGAGGGGVEQVGCLVRGGRSRGGGGWGHCARGVQALVDTWGGQEGGCCWGKRMREMVGDRGGI